uniref:Uncharacterized protein n=1 Tax=Chenopodium quinoa TaxID=63459 RepID=A0A803MSC4_CHEQI
MDVDGGDVDPPDVGKFISLGDDIVDDPEFCQDSVDGVDEFGCEGSMEHMELYPSSNMCFEFGCVGNGISMENMELLNHSSPLLGSQEVVYQSPIQTVCTVQTVETLRIEVKERRKKFIAKNGVQLLPSRKYPPSEKVSTNNVITPSSVTKPSAMYEGWVEGSIQEDVEWVDLEPEITESLVDPPPPVTQQVLDPKSRKHPRGRPKGSRNKTLAELGYKKKTKAILALVDENEPGADEVVAPTLADKPMNKRRKATKKRGPAGEVAATPTSYDEKSPAEKPIPKQKGRKRKATTKRGAAGEGVASPTSSFEF